MKTSYHKENSITKNREKGEKKIFEEDIRTKILYKTIVLSSFIKKEICSGRKTV